MQRVRDIILYIIVSASVLSMLLGAVSCGRLSVEDGGPISFDVDESLPEEWVPITKASINTYENTISFAEGDRFNVYTWHGEDIWMEMADIPVTLSDGSWNYSPLRKWPEDGILSFYAYGAYRTDDENPDIMNYLEPKSVGGETNAPAISYNIDGQTDILCSKLEDFSHSGPDGGSRQPRMTFDHPLMRLLFRTVMKEGEMQPGTNPVSCVESITVKDCKTAVSLDLRTGAVQFEDTPTSAFSISPSAGVTWEIAPSEDAAIIERSIYCDSGMDVLDIEAVVRGKTLSTQVAVPEGRGVNYCYLINLIFRYSVEDIQLEVAIVPWKDVTVAETGIGKYGVLDYPSIQEWEDLDMHPGPVDGVDDVVEDVDISPWEGENWTGQDFGVEGELIITAPVFRYDGVKQQRLSIISKMINAYGEELPTDWMITGYSTDGGYTWAETPPDWITSIEDSGSGDLLGEYPDIEVNAQSGMYTNILGRSLPAGTFASNTPKGEAGSPWNLSNGNGGLTPQRTANCYIVDAPGTYAIPLVYGNAIDMAKTAEAPYHNTSSYTSSSGSLFVNHLNIQISSPYMQENNGVNPNNAVLAWIDLAETDNYVTVDSAIKEYDDVFIPGTSEKLKFIEFTVDKDSFTKTSNAVIAVRDASNTVIWSWHIWITDENMTPISVTSETGSVYQMLPVNLGWVLNGKIAHTSRYEERTCMVKVLQPYTGVSAEFTVTQSEWVNTREWDSGNSPYYQWGRKDPHISVDLFGELFNREFGLKTYSGLYGFDTVVGKVSVGVSIKNPHLFYFSGDNLPDLDVNWCTPSKDDLWSDTKTIYDPSPVGYIVPPLDAFTGFKGNYAEEFYNGCSFYADPQGINRVTFYRVGFRHAEGSNSGDVLFENSLSYYWSRTTDTGNNGYRPSYRFGVAKERKDLTDPNKRSALSYIAEHRSYGCTIRPVKE